MSATTFALPAQSVWRVTHTVPHDWHTALERSGGGVFHTPVGLRSDDPDGTPFYAALEADGQTVGVAAGVWKHCRLSRKPRHVLLAAYPALADPVFTDLAFAALLRDLRAAGAAEVMLDSFDSHWPPPANPPGAAPSEHTDRLEYVVSLERGSEERRAALSDNHRRKLQRSERCGWELRLPAGKEAGALLSVVWAEATARARERGDPFDIATAAPLDAGPRWPAPWGVQLFAAFDGATPLSAALVGWANRRAYYLSGGSTPDGYAQGASVWLQWHIMAHFAGAGFTAYNLGGAPYDAVIPRSPSHGLHRFKNGFGPDILRCRSLRWEVRPVHGYAHAAARRVAGWLQGEVATR